MGAHLGLPRNLKVSPKHSRHKRPFGLLWPTRQNGFPSKVGGTRPHFRGVCPTHFNERASFPASNSKGLVSIHLNGQHTFGPVLHPFLTTWPTEGSH